MVLGEVEETITIVDVNEETLEEVIRVCTHGIIIFVYMQLTFFLQ
jgi:hypothetical protein